jgi:hypothetical protein
VKIRCECIERNLKALRKEDYSPAICDLISQEITFNLLELLWFSGKNPFNVTQKVGNWFLQHWEEEVRVFRCVIADYDEDEDRGKGRGDYLRKRLL